MIKTIKAETATEHIREFLNQWNILVTRPGNLGTGSRYNEGGK